jgi:uncharacterized flavoprotein (TIGR03862 family)
MKHVRVVGAGPAGLMAAEVLATAGHRVTIIDHHKNPARKFLLAGRGGLNLTHSESLESFLASYGHDQSWLEPSIRAFPPEALRQWAKDLGIETFVGSTGRVFPVGLKTSPLLRAWLKRLAGLGVELKSQTAWNGFDDVTTVLAMGGNSWPELGSNAAWVQHFTTANIATVPFEASNVRQPVAWSEIFVARFKGQPIKNIALTVGAKRVLGEVMIAEDGIEGGAVYALSRLIRETSADTMTLDLKPDMALDAVEGKLANRWKKDSTSNFLRKSFNLSPQAIGLMRETGTLNPKSVVIKLSGKPAIARAISSAGGVAKHELDDNFKLLKRPNTYVVGEMLDWDAPTGGYLLQACFSTAKRAATALAKDL